ncbi:MAG: hypothetical protein HY272_14310 [Gammaproteobacteria bacterium]|nr:hypothetical protein [Gammaproteobacteria bacterium]
MTDLIIDIDVNRLAVLIGREVNYSGNPCQIVEILEDGPALVLQYHNYTIQADQHGEAHRKAPNTVIIPIYDHEGNGWHPEFAALRLTHLL